MPQIPKAVPAQTPQNLVETSVSHRNVAHAPTSASTECCRYSSTFCESINIRKHQLTGACKSLRDLCERHFLCARRPDLVQKLLHRLLTCSRLSGKRRHLGLCLARGQEGLQRSLARQCTRRIRPLSTTAQRRTAWPWPRLDRPSRSFSARCQ